MSTRITCLGRTKEHNTEVGGVPTSYHVAENTPTGKVQAADLVPFPDDDHVLHFAADKAAEWDGDTIDERLKIIIRALAMMMHKLPSDNNVKWFQFIRWYIKNHTTGVDCVVHDAGTDLHAHIEVDPKKGFEVELI